MAISFVRAAAVSAASLLCVLSAGCGGGGGGGGATASTGTATPSAPAPTAPAAPTPTSFVIRSADTAYRTNTTGIASMAARPASDNLTVTITDNNGATNLAGVNWGNQRVVVHFFDGAGIAYDRTFTPAEFSAGVFTTTNAAGARNMGLSSWRTVAGTDTHEYRLYRLLETGGKPADFVQLGEWSTLGSTSRTGGFHLMGEATPVASMPVSGAATYSGTAAGRYYNASAPSFSGTAFTAIATVDVSFDARSVRTNMAQFAYEGATGPNLTITAVTPIFGNSFGGAVSLPATSGPALAGTIQGSFYGPANSPAAEVGAVFELFTPTQGIVGGLVAGR